jgi:hypothetical protein
MAKKTRAELSTEAVTTNLPDNNQELITPATERAQLASERESTLNYKDDLSGITPGHILTVGGDNESIDFIDNTIPTSGQVTEWDDAYDKRIDSLTTTGTSGAATLAANVLNIPEYGTGDVKKTGTITAEQAAFWNDSTDTLRSEAAFYKSGGNFVITTNLSAIGGRSLSAQFLNLYDNPYLRIQAQASGTVAFNSLEGAATFSGQINANNGISFPTPSRGGNVDTNNASEANAGTVASSVLDAYDPFINFGYNSRGRGQVETQQVL